MRKFLLALLCMSLLFGSLQLVSCKRSFPDDFKEYQVGKRFTVHFNFPDLAMEEFTDREKGDQARDWMLYMLLCHSKLDQKSLAETIFDLAPVRYGFNNSLANFEYGETRSKFIGNGQVLALIPVSDENRQTDNIAHIVDDIRKNQGEKPKKLYVFEYSLNTEGKFAHITRLKDIEASTYFTEAKGYYEFAVSNLEDLKSFMEKTDDITYVSQEVGGMTLGGRHLFSMNYGKATPEDVAAIWQSEKNIQTAQERGQDFISQWNSASDSVFDIYNSKIKELTFDDGTTFESLTVDEKNEIIKYVGDMVAGKGVGIGYRRYGTDSQTIQFIAEFKQQLSIVDNRFKARKYEFESGEYASSTGFSLDAAVDFDNAIEFVEENSYWFETALENTNFTLDQLLDQLRHKNDDLLLYAMANVDKETGGMLGIGDEATEKYMYQRARYDGRLRGTAAGMTLFYTDLLAKIWAANILDAHPDVNITGFKDLEQTSFAAARVFKEESHSLPNCRLWFGPNKNGFQVGEMNKELAFSRNATEIFALSHDPSASASIDKEGISTHAEVQASKEFEVVLNWWNNHFEEVGQFESQYQRLNELMKWSTVISWLNNQFGNTSLDFLSDYPVNHDHWFPEWAKADKSLKFTEWDKIHFYDKGSFGNNTESIPILESANKFFSGGVSLAPKSLLKESPEILSAENVLFRRANLKKDLAFGDEISFTTIKETRINFIQNAEANTYKIQLQAKPDFKLRSHFGEVQNARFEWDLTKGTEGSYTFSSNLGTVPIGKIQYAKTGTNGFTIGFESMAIDKGMAIARQVSDFSGDVSVLLNKHPQVEKYMLLPDGDLCVKMKNSDELMIMKVSSADATPEVNLSAGWQARTSGVKTNSRIVELKWVNEAEATGLNNGKSLAFTITNKGDDAIGRIQQVMATKSQNEASAELAKLREEVIAEAENLAKSGDYEKAASQINRLIAHLGETPEITIVRVRYELQAGLKALESGSTQTAAKYINEAFASGLRKGDKTGFFDEISRYINDSEVRSNMKEKITDLSKLYLTDNEVIVRASWEGYRSNAKEIVSLQDLSSKGAKIFYGDIPAFNKINTSLPREEVIAQLRSIPGVKVYDISANAIGKNTRVYISFESGLSTYVNLMKANGDLDAIINGLSPVRLRVYPGSAVGTCPDDNDDGKDDCDDYTYTVEGPVYYVTAPSTN